VTRNTDIGPNGYNDWNENNLKNLTTNNWRASLVPAAAVIPAPRVYIKVVAVKKLVVGFLMWVMNELKTHFINLILFLWFHFGVSICLL